jgi:hypothetical protein
VGGRRRASGGMEAASRVWEVGSVRSVCLLTCCRRYPYKRMSGPRLVLFFKLICARERCVRFGRS